METLNILSATSSKIDIITVVMKTAHRLFKSENWFKTWSETMREAWKIVKNTIKEIKMLSIGKHVELKTLNKMLIENADFVEFGYIKKDGSFRIFNATKNFDIIPSDKIPTSNTTASNLRFFDKNSNDWRGLTKDCQYVYML